MHRVFSSLNRNERLILWVMEKTFWSTSKNDLETYDKVWKNVIDQGDDYTTGFVLVYLYLKKSHKEQDLDANPKAI